MRHEPRAEHRFRVLLDLVARFRELHAAGLAAASRVHLSLHDPEMAAKRTCGHTRLGGRRRDLAFWDGNAVLGKQSLRLILVQIHRLTGIGKRSRPTGGRRYSPRNVEDCANLLLVSALRNDES